MKNKNLETLQIRIPKKMSIFWKNQAREHNQSLEEYLHKILQSRSIDYRLSKLSVSKILKLTTPQDEENRTDFYS